MRRKPLAAKKAAGPTPRIRSSLFPRSPEVADDLHAVIRRLLGDRVHESQEELMAALNGIRDSGQLDAAFNAPGSNPREEAQRLTARAYQVADDDKARELVARALELDPGNTDAMLLEIPFDTAGSLPRLREIVALAREHLGEAAFTEDLGHFWGVAHTREYMRAHHKLALACFWSRQFPEAIVEMERMLELDQRDVLAVREMLLPLYLRDKAEAPATALIARFEGHESALWQWAIFLHAMLFGDEKQRRFALGDAYRVNRFMPDHIFGYAAKERPSLRDYYEPGSEDEANSAALVLLPVIAAHPEATTQWLADLILKQELK